MKGTDSDSVLGLLPGIDKINQTILSATEREFRVYLSLASYLPGLWELCSQLTPTLTPTLSLALGHRVGRGAQVGPPVEVREERDQREVHAVADEEHAGVASRAAGHVLQRRPRGGEPQPGARRCKVVRLLCCLRVWSVVQ